MVFINIAVYKPLHCDKKSRNVMAYFTEFYRLRRVYNIDGVCLESGRLNVIKLIRLVYILLGCKLGFSDRALQYQKGIGRRNNPVLVNVGTVLLYVTELYLRHRALQSQKCVGRRYFAVFIDVA